MVAYFDPKVATSFQSATQKAGTNWHLARQKMMFGLIFSISETRQVQFTELATKLNGDAKDESNLPHRRTGRIQAFFPNYTLDYRVIACVLMSLVTAKQCRISIDRTNWQFGDQAINILTLTVYSHGVGYYYHRNRSPIPLKKHGYKSNSFFRKGLDLLRHVCKFIESRGFLFAHYLSWLEKDLTLKIG